ncbi:MAG: GldM family protein [Bacteroidota bacterium]|nr:GldM family protein [Bacteroidota bacterium]
MKNLLLFFSVIFVLTSCTKTNEKQELSSPVVSVDKMNVLYIGLDNPISVAVPGIASEKLVLEPDFGTIKDTNGNYTWDISDIDKNKKEVHLKIFVKIDEENEKLAGEKTFRVENVPEPKASVNDVSIGYFAKEKVADIDSLKIILANFVYDEQLYLDVTKFRFVYNRLEGNSSLINSRGSCLSEKTKELLASSEPQKGDRIIIDNIYAETPNKGEVRIPSIIILILY